MNSDTAALAQHCVDYSRRLQSVLDQSALGQVSPISRQNCAPAGSDGRQVFICGNGGSAANAMHLANDFLYGISKRLGSGIRVSALSANPSVLTCLANDCGYEAIFSDAARRAGPRGRCADRAVRQRQLAEHRQRARTGRKAWASRATRSFGYDGGKAKALADVPIHFDVRRHAD